MGDPRGDASWDSSPAKRQRYISPRCVVILATLPLFNYRRCAIARQCNLLDLTDVCNTL